jgi:myo-inositol 2-dehydrogenase / D-chiro-inositol 1-dehydrogenase
VSVPIHTALVGCGSLGRVVHLPILTRLADVRVVALADSDPASLAAAGALAPDAARFADHHELLTRGPLDAVVVALPTALHASVASDAISAGKHVYLEKPIAANLPDAERLVACWRESGRVGMIGFNYRFHPLYTRLRTLIGEGAIGTIVAMRTVFSAPPGPNPPWKSRRSSGGGALLDLGIHHLDLVRFLFGREVRTVAAQLHSVETEDDRVSVDLELEGGIIVQSLFALGVVEEDRVEVYGERGKLTVDRHHSVSVEQRAARAGSSRAARLGLGRRGPSLRGVLSSPVLAQRLRAPTAEPSYRASLASFFAAVANGRPASPDLAEGLRALEIAGAAMRSAAEGRRIPVADRSAALVSTPLAR